MIAHGSRRKQSNDEVIELTSKMNQQKHGDIAHVQAGFLELAEPSISASIKACIESGATEIRVFPYFLAAGRHVTVDIPRQVAEVAAEFPGVKIALLPHLGQSVGLPDFLWQHADLPLTEAKAPESLQGNQAKVAARVPKAVQLEVGSYAWCRCGLSQNQPFCDGSHAGTAFTPLVFEQKEAQKRALCQCKQTKTPPFCDGSHRDIPEF